MSPTATNKPLLWLLEEATPEVAQLMHQLERSVGGQARVHRVTYTDALRQLVQQDTREGLVAIIAFRWHEVRNLAALIKGLPAPRPRLCFLPPTLQAASSIKPHHRWPIPVSAVARHLGEAAAMQVGGWREEHLVLLAADVTLAHLPESQRPMGTPLRVGLAWYNMGPTQREVVTTEIQRWHQSAPEHFEWSLYHLPGDAPDAEALPGVHCVAVDAALLSTGRPHELDVVMADPWWPDGLPRPFNAPVQIHLPPGGATGERWQERLQALLDLAREQPWNAATLLAFRFQPLWRHLLAGEERALPTIPMVDSAALAERRDALQTTLTAMRERWADTPEDPAARAYYLWLYDHRVQVSWCLGLWEALAEARNGERLALMQALNALSLHHTSSAWLFKRLMAKTPLARAGGMRRSLPRRFWLRFAMRHFSLVKRWVKTLSRCGRDELCDPLGASREVAKALLAEAGVTIRRRNDPAPVPGMPTIYLFSHRHGELDPFLLLDTLPGNLAVVVGPRAQRWPLIGRLAHSSAFVLTGRERGVVMADAIAAVRARRALALYPEVSEPTYLGESSPMRPGLLWIIQALERSQVIPVVLDDPFALGPDGGTLDLWFGEPILCSPETGETLFHEVRRFIHQHVARTRALDTEERLERTVSAPVEAAAEATN